MKTSEQDDFRQTQVAGSVEPQFSFSRAITWALADPKYDLLWVEDRGAVRYVSDHPTCRP